MASYYLMNGARNIVDGNKTRVIVSQLSGTERFKRLYYFSEEFFLKVITDKVPCLEHQFGGHVHACQPDAVIKPKTARCLAVCYPRSIIFIDIKRIDVSLLLAFFFSVGRQFQKLRRIGCGSC